jgi:type IV pilus assembly protein PilO
MTYDGDLAPSEFEEEVKDYPALFGISLTPKLSGILIAALGLGGALYLGNQFVLPAYQNFQELKTNVATKEAELQQKTETVRRIDEIIASLNQAKAVNTEVKALFSDQETLETLLLDLNQLIVQTKAQLVTFTPDYTTSGPVTDGSLGPELNGKLKRQVTSVAFDGTFNQTLTIMRNLERLQTFLVVKDFSAELPGNTGSTNTSNTAGQPGQPQKSQDQIRSTFKLHAYVPLTPEEAAAAAKTTAAPAESEQSAPQSQE